MNTQQIKSTVKSKSKYEYETFDVGNKALLFDDAKEKDVFAAIDELGLKGQKELVSTQNNKVIPFPKMNITEQRVWEVYCPQKDKLEDYSATTIPYEIMTILQLVKQKKYFDINEPEIENAPENSKALKGYIQIWSEAREDIDPLVVGVIETSTKYNWGWSHADKTYYLIARWGISLRPFDEICKTSIERWVTQREQSLAADIRKAKLAFENVLDDANKHFSGQFFDNSPINIDDIPF